MDLDRALNVAKDAAIRAGDRILQYYGEVTVEMKDDDSPVTQADLAGNNVIMTTLRAEFPDCAFLTEEEADDGSRLGAEYVWIIDPLDGTKEFIRQNGEFTVNIALVHDGRPVLGVIYLPAKENLYWAANGDGAWLNGKDIVVSDHAVYEHMVLTHSRSHASDIEKELAEEFRSVRPAGSSLKGCLVASGAADVYLRTGPTNEWDVCAMDCIIHEAGGTMTLLDGTRRVYNQEDTLLDGFLASNGAKHDELLERVRNDSDSL
jgi:3'(2'), 5'-bisphosphate nucleotidase